MVLIAAPAPAFAASPPVYPFTITATAGTSNNANKTVLTFSGRYRDRDLVGGGQGERHVHGFSSNPLIAPGSTMIEQGQNYTSGATYIVTYVFNSVTYVQPVVAA